MSFFIWVGILLTVAGATGLISCFARHQWHPEAYVQAPVSALEYEFLSYFDENPSQQPTKEERDRAVIRVVVWIVAFGIGISVLGFGLAATIAAPTF